MAILTSKSETLRYQRRSNRFNKKYLLHVNPLKEDGVQGKLTLLRAQSDKYHLGYGARRKSNAKTITTTLLRALKSPKGRFIPRRTRVAGEARRRAQRIAARAAHAAATVTPGVTTWGGRPVAKAAVCHLNWARDNGWRGGLNSGWRSIPYSISLCFRICNRAFCPGRCAGASTNHVGKTCERFAIDVSDYVTFERLMPRSPCKCKIKNELDARDPVHFSPNGR